MADATAVAKPTKAPSVIERRKLKSIRLQEIQAEGDVDSPLSSGSKGVVVVTGEGNKLASAEKDLSFWDEMSAATQHATDSVPNSGSSRATTQASSG